MTPPFDDEAKKEIAKAVLVAAATAGATVLANAGVQALKRMIRPLADEFFPEPKDPKS